VIDRLKSSLKQLDAWIEKEDFKGWDPHDALNSPLLKRLAFGNRRMGQVWVQLLKNSPVNLRPVLGVPKGYNPKAIGLFLATYWRKYLLSQNETHLRHAQCFADWLQKNVSPGYHGACWGYNFDWPNRDFCAPTRTPAIVNTAFNALAFLDLDMLPDPTGSAAWGDYPIKIARGACEFILRDLWIEKPSKDERCFSYTPLDRRRVHNANVLGALLLAQVGTRTSESELIEASLEAARYTVRRQQSDGSWIYGESSRDNWVDNFHTGYVLVALKRIGEVLQTSEFDSAVMRGYRFWKETMFEQDGVARYYANRLYPIDAHCIAQAILTFLEFADRDPEAIGWALRVADWGIRNMQDKDGYFHYQIQPRYRIRTPYMRWTQAWMQRSMTELVGRMSIAGSDSGRAD
jgi:hypothetical protein